MTVQHQVVSSASSHTFAAEAVYAAKPSSSTGDRVDFFFFFPGLGCYGGHILTHPHNYTSTDG